MHNRFKNITNMLTKSNLLSSKKRFKIHCKDVIKATTCWMVILPRNDVFILIILGYSLSQWRHITWLVLYQGKVNTLSVRSDVQPKADSNDGSRSSQSLVRQQQYYVWPRKLPVHIANQTIRKHTGHDCWLMY